MHGEADSRKPGSDRAGPQGTQVYSREDISALLDESAPARQSDGASLVLIARGDAEQGGKRQVFPLKSDRVTVGRSHICDVCVDEPSMSSEHARLVRSDGAWRIINLLSTNGVFVNGEKVFSHRLEDGDEIRLGRTTLRFHDPKGRGESKGGIGPLVWGAVAAGAVGLALLAFWLIG